MLLGKTKLCDGNFEAKDSISSVAEVDSQLLVPRQTRMKVISVLC